jgi:hypothetical protein
MVGNDQTENLLRPLPKGRRFHSCNRRGRPLVSSKKNSIRSLITCVYRQRWTWFLQFSPANKAFKYLRVLGRLFFRTYVFQR